MVPDCVGREVLGHVNIRSGKMEKQIRRGDPRRQNYWEEVVRRWQEDGRSVRDFCQAEGLRESAFYFWRRKLRRVTNPQGP